MTGASKKGVIVGIDLGTTYSLVATMQGDSPVILPNALGELLTPSAVSIGADGTTLIGSVAKARAATHPERTALAFKRDMGTDKQLNLGPRSFRPEELSALVLQQLREDAEQALGLPVQEAVVTVPAYFGELQRRATRDACDIAGLEVERIINEPTAAAMAYGLHEKHRELRAVVLDLGGGTFDVTVLEIIEGVIEIQSSAGDSRLGGEDFVAALAAHCVKLIAREHGRDIRALPLAAARLHGACEAAKIRLTDTDRAGIALPDLPLGPGRTADVELRLSRAEAEELWQPLLERIRQPIRRALADASLKADDIDEVLLVGGATRMPCVAKLASQLFGKLPLRTLPPDEAVALGAAVQAALKAGDEAVDDMVVTDVAPFTLGISTAKKMGSQIIEGLFSPILERGTVLPASRVKSFATISHDQTELMVEVYQGEHSLCRDNQKLGEYTVRGIPRSPAGEQEIEVRFSYDLNGILEVDCTILATKQTSTLVIEKSPGRLTPREVKQARQALKRLKFHPRDALPNVTILARADALFVELTGSDRELLGGEIGALRLALETQDSAAIEHQRNHLAALVASLGARARPG